MHYRQAGKFRRGKHGALNVHMRIDKGGQKVLLRGRSKRFYACKEPLCQVQAHRAQLPLQDIYQYSIQLHRLPEFRLGSFQIVHRVKKLLEPILHPSYSYICNNLTPWLILKRSYTIFIYLLLALALVLGGCQSSNKGRKQPKRGPIPCPVKDC
ncbi:hypothetical protein ADICEAN_03169 [Cesiribacter andamanensis AMV16]|uniref:Uncharacterized protein n=1 Tax=Cesiribacter andamanensis AMV16 TaxID=1279009 RepID=M7MZ07_9BACT|nr:hypothetical protein ADICEAN_03169 [Cesiribacter andamanensis AMV16]